MVTCLLSLAHAEIEPLPLIVKPPSSSGVNQGFSRAPSRTFYAQGKNILVIEGIGATIYKSKKGNNTVFYIIEYYIDPEGKELKKTSWAIFEGTDRLTNEMTFSYENIASYTFREELGDGECCIYMVLFTEDGGFRQLGKTFFDKEGRFKQQEKFIVGKDGTIQFECVVNEEKRIGESHFPLSFLGNDK